jgi:hypothetical protein
MILLLATISCRVDIGTISKLTQSGPRPRSNIFVERHDHIIEPTVGDGGKWRLEAKFAIGKPKPTGNQVDW